MYMNVYIYIYIYIYIHGHKFLLLLLVCVCECVCVGGVGGCPWKNSCQRKQGASVKSCLLRHRLQSCMFYFSTYLIPIIPDKNS